MYDHLAVCIKNVGKSYGSNKILRKLSLNVERGSIYGLLGASGCGKTTLLNIITGRIKVDSGEIYVLGEKQLEVPGDTVGYMPQTLSLIGEFTVKDTIYFFGRIYNVPEETIKRRYTELVELLELPTDNSYIKNCSGGQQRRVSFAASMVHQPELLILDEPTVGTDPILRDRVWKYLMKISQEDKTTVIITTHYIEETRQANQVGLMREGTILIEEDPMKLLSIYRVDSLEEVFLILSTQQERGMIKADNRQSTASGNVNLGYDSSEINLHELTDITEKKVMPIEEEKKVKKAKKTNPTFAWYRFKALLGKNYKTLSRNYGASIFPMVITFVQVLFFLVAVGKDTTDNPFGILNAERSVEFCQTFPINETAIPYDTWNCQINSVSCLFEDYLDIPLLKKIHYDSAEKALEDLKNGKIRGFINIHPNISKLMETRISEGLDLYDLPDEEIQVYMDMTSLHIGGAIKTKIYNLYEKFHEEIHENCKYLSQAIKLPLRVEETFYGTADDEYTIFITPGIVTTMIYFMGVLTTCIIILDEKCEGIWDRSIIAGVTALELSMSHLIYQIAFMVITVLELIVLIFFVFQQPYAGSLWLIFALIYLQGVAGIALGFGISIWSTNHIMANIIVSGIFNPLVLASGVMWPIESLNEYLLWVANFLPLAIPTTALRNIIRKGWSLNNLNVLHAFGILCLWIIILLTFNIYLMKRKR